MEPQIRYVHSADGASIATRTLGVPGRRPDVVVMPSAFVVVTTPASLAAPEVRAGLERLAESRRVILFDARGTGLSDRNVADFSSDAWLADVQAVVEQAADGHVDLIAPRSSSPMAIAYAAGHREQVRRLILVEPVTSAGDDPTPRIQALSALIDFDFEMYQRHAALEVFGWTETGRRVAEGLRGTVTRDVWHASDGPRRELDVRNLLRELICPTLVLQYTGMHDGAREAPRRIAARIPDARLVLNAGGTPLLFAFDPEGDASLVLNFLDEDVAETAATPVPQGTAIILFTDIVDSTGQTERLGDNEFRIQARVVEHHLRAIINEHGGSAIDGKLLGDGVMAVFLSASRAVECALACHGATIETSLSLHAGLHAGDVIREDGNVFGGAVNIASRISALSAAGEVLVSDIVRGLARTSAGVTFEDRGEQALKGIDDPVRVFAVRPTPNG